jgi:hypothetical protein
MASGDTLAVLLPQGYEPPSSNYATLDLRNNRPVLDFDDTTDESAVWTFIMPQHYAGTTGITVHIWYAMSSATSGDIDWGIQIERTIDGVTIASDDFAAAQLVQNTTVPGTAGLIDEVTIAFTDGSQMDSLVVGEVGRLKIYRDADQDTATGDAELVALEIRET